MLPLMLLRNSDLYNRHNQLASVRSPEANETEAKRHTLNPGVCEWLKMELLRERDVSWIYI